MRLSDLKAMRERGQRPASGLVLVRDGRTRGADHFRGQVVAVPEDAKASWRPIAGLTVHFWPSRWEWWTLPLIEAMQRGEPKVLSVRDPVSDDLICCLVDGQAFPIACEVDSGEAWLAAYRTVRAAR